MINDVIIGIKRKLPFLEVCRSRMANFGETVILEIDDKASLLIW